MGEPGVGTLPKVLLKVIISALAVKWSTATSYSFLQYPVTNRTNIFFFLRGNKFRAQFREQEAWDRKRK